MKLEQFIAELKRRRVFRVLVGYGVVAFAVLQIIEPVIHALHLPDTALSYAVLALGMGFPVAVVLAWAFDVNEGRIERSAPAPTPHSRPAVAAVLVGIGLAAAAPGLIYYFVVRKPPAAAGTTSVAVLPFVNISANAENEYFSDGMTEELINALANIPGLRVVSRTSAFAFKGKDVSVQKIGEDLNVGAVVEGSIRRDGGNLRITAQLIDASNGYHVWSATYDREVKNIFAVEEELARSIVHALKSRLVPSGATPVVKPPTANLVAHDRYLKAGISGTSAPPSRSPARALISSRRLKRIRRMRWHMSDWRMRPSSKMNTARRPLRRWCRARAGRRSRRYRSTTRLPKRTMSSA